MKESNLIFGRNAVTEAINSGREIEKIIVQQGTTGSAVKIAGRCRDLGITVEKLPKDKMDRIAGTSAHQGVICRTSAHAYAELDDILGRCASKGEPSLLIVLDGIEDPHNLGAIMRTAECAGADGIIIPKNRSCGLTETVAKVSAGAIEYMPCARVTNLARTLEELKEAGFWIYAADMDGRDIWQTDLKGNVAIVIGNEGKGISKLVKEKCDFVVSIPLAGKINSLNASNACAVLIYEAVRQRRKA